MRYASSVSETAATYAASLVGPSGKPCDMFAHMCAYVHTHVLVQKEGEGERDAEAEEDRKKAGAETEMGGGGAQE